jgi:hypothetical protein
MVGSVTGMHMPMPTTRFIPILACILTVACSPLEKLQTGRLKPASFPKEWITRSTSLEQESANINRFRAKIRPLWTRFIKQIQPGDRLYYWEFDDKFENKRYWGYCISRNDMIFAYVHLDTWTTIVT